MAGLELTNNTLLLILILGLIVLFVSMRCSFSCGGAEGFSFTRISHPDLGAYAYSDDYVKVMTDKDGKVDRRVPLNLHPCEDRPYSHEY